MGRWASCGASAKGRSGLLLRRLLLLGPAVLLRPRCVWLPSWSGAWAGPGLRGHSERHQLRPLLGACGTCSGPLLGCRLPEAVGLGPGACALLVPVLLRLCAALRQHGASDGCGQVCRGAAHA